MSAEVMMMLLADARLPTGAHTQSAGLEPALRAGMRPADAPAYIRARLRTVTAVEAAAAVVARARTIDTERLLTTRGMAAVNLTVDLTADPAVDLTADPAVDLTVDPAVDPAADAAADLGIALLEVDAAWRARTVSPALRATSVLLGRGYARLVGRLWPTTVGAAALVATGRPGRAVVLGVAAALGGLSGAQLVRLIGYDDAQTVAAATLKLEPLDPVVAAGWVMAAGAEIERMVGGLAELTEIDQMPALGAPLIEQWAEIHSVTSQRFFRA